ncbi:MAG: hypothetical protein HYW50_04965 [Candidatus Diapherotrites archaeon]|nr:hypothetical protein [Candidatus Diapherotrites archaeon]
MENWEENVVKKLKGIFDFSDWAKSTFEQNYPIENLFQGDVIERRFDNVYVELRDPNNTQGFIIRKKWAVYLTKFGFAFPYSPGLIFYNENCFNKTKLTNSRSVDLMPIVVEINMHPENEEHCVIIHFNYRMFLRLKGSIKIYAENESEIFDELKKRTKVNCSEF